MISKTIFANDTSSTPTAFALVVVNRTIPLLLFKASTNNLTHTAITYFTRTIELSNLINYLHVVKLEFLQMQKILYML
jgi:hypothetical protein